LQVVILGQSGSIATMKSPFAPTISSVDIQMPNVMTLKIQKK
jgi:hypothetical protein